MKKILLFLTLIIFTQNAYAKKIGVFLYVSESEGDKIYNYYTKDLGFKRNLSIGKIKNIEYHVTLGFIENVEFSDAKDLKTNLKNYLNFKSKNITFEYGASSLLGKNVPYIVAIPKNVQIFRGLNCEINKFIKHYKSGKYNLTQFTQEEFYIPHLSLNAKIHSDIKIENLEKILLELNKKMFNSKIILSKLVIKIE